MGIVDSLGHELKSFGLGRSTALVALPLVAAGTAGALHNAYTGPTRDSSKARGQHHSAAWSFTAGATISGVAGGAALLSTSLGPGGGPLKLISGIGAVVGATLIGAGWIQERRAAQTEANELRRREEKSVDELSQMVHSYTKEASTVETKRALDFLAAAPGSAPTAGSVSKWVSGFDLNKDRTLQREEMDALYSAFHSEFRHRLERGVQTPDEYATEVFTKYDVSRDGVLSSDEMPARLDTARSPLSRDQLVWLLARADADRNGLVGSEEVKPLSPDPGPRPAASISSRQRSVAPAP